MSNHAIKKHPSKPARGHVHPNPPKGEHPVFNPIRMIEPQTRRALRQEDYRRRHPGRAIG